MPRISQELHALLLAAAALGTITFALTVIPLEKNISRIIRRIFAGTNHLGGIPTPRPAGLWGAFVISIVVTICAGTIASTAPVLEPVKLMTGTFRIVVASFEENGRFDKKEFGTQLAEEVRTRLEQNIEKVSPGLDITVWGPSDLAPMGLDQIKGKTAGERNKQAEALANQIDASLVVYGSLGQEDDQTVFTPEFFINESNSYEAQEITGPHEFGQQIVIEPSEIGGRIEVGSQMFTRCSALTNIAVGLSHYFNQHFDLAITAYQQADTISTWTDPQGKKILYLLMGNALLRRYTQFVQEKQPSPPALLDDAEKYYNQSKQIDNDYARTYIGLGSVDYLRALIPFQQSKAPADIDEHWLLASRANYQKALTAAEQPPLADIPAKVQFGFGQVELMQAYSGRSATLNPAIAEFRQVIEAYDSGKNTRIEDLAAEAHARLGLAFALSGHPQEAASEYQQAADLLGQMHNHDRREEYQDRANKMQGITPTP